MPVQKFRSIADMPDPPRRLPGDPALYRAIATVWASSRAANPRRFRPGVYKYRSIEEMNRAQEQLDAEHVAELRRQRHGRTTMPTLRANGSQMVDRELIDDVVRRVVERFHPKRVVLFGSHARGDADPESDIDLFIEMESNQRPLDRMIAVSSLFGNRRWGLDVFVYTPEEVTARRGDPGDLLAYVDAEGIVLYDRDAR